MDLVTKIFEKMKKEGKANVEALIEWMKNAKVIASKESEDKARSLFSEAKDKSNVELEEFKNVVGKLAADQKASADEFTKLLAEGGNTVASALAAGASAVKDAFKMK